MSHIHDELTFSVTITDRKALANAGLDTCRLFVMYSGVFVPGSQEIQGQSFQTNTSSINFPGGLYL